MEKVTHVFQEYAEKIKNIKTLSVTTEKVTESEKETLGGDIYSNIQEKLTQESHIEELTKEYRAEIQKLLTNEEISRDFIRYLQESGAINQIISLNQNVEDIRTSAEMQNVLYLENNNEAHSEYEIQSVTEAISETQIVQILSKALFTSYAGTDGSRYDSTYLNKSSSTYENAYADKSSSTYENAYADESSSTYENAYADELSSTYENVSANESGNAYKTSYGDTYENVYNDTILTYLQQYAEDTEQSNEFHSFMEKVERVFRDYTEEINPIETPRVDTKTVTESVRETTDSNTDGNTDGNTQQAAHNIVLTYLQQYAADTEQSNELNRLVEKVEHVFQNYTREIENIRNLNVTVIRKQLAEEYRKEQLREEIQNLLEHEEVSRSFIRHQLDAFYLAKYNAVHLDNERKAVTESVSEAEIAQKLSKAFLEKYETTYEATIHGAAKTGKYKNIILAYLQQYADSIEQSKELNRFIEQVEHVLVDYIEEAYDKEQLTLEYRQDKLHEELQKLLTNSEISRGFIKHLKETIDLDKNHGVYSSKEMRLTTESVSEAQITRLLSKSLLESYAGVYGAMSAGTYAGTYENPDENIYDNTYDNTMLTYLQQYVENTEQNNEQTGFYPLQTNVSYADADSWSSGYHGITYQDMQIAYATDYFENAVAPEQIQYAFPVAKQENGSSERVEALMGNVRNQIEQVSRNVKELSADQTQMKNEFIRKNDIKAFRRELVNHLEEDITVAGKRQGIF
jgi:hypothetical protein